MIAGATRAQTPLSEPARQLHMDAIVIDTHSDFLDRASFDGSGLADDPPHAQTTLSKLRAGGIDAQFFSVFVPPAYASYGYVRRTHELIDELYQQVAANAEQIAIATSADDLIRVTRQGKVAALIGIEGGHSIDNRLSHLRNYYRLGVRYLTLTWNNTNDWADAAGDRSRWSGLTGFGESVVREMNQLGMMVDVSHVAADTFWDVMRITRSPVIASHSASAHLTPADRNLSDEMIRAIAENGGVIQLTFYAKHIDSAFADALESALDARAEQLNSLADVHLLDPVQLDASQWDLEKTIERSLPPPPLAAVLDHIDHLVRIGGIDHVGIGSDYDGMGSAPADLAHAGQLPNLTQALLDRGYSNVEVKKVLGENLLRVMRENERLATPGLVGPDRDR
jgi:membrane dipeptidase